MSQNIGIYQTIDKPALVAYNNDLYLMWKETGDLGIYTSKSTDQGLTWSAEQRTSYGINSTIGPTFTITPDGTIHLVYRGTDSVGMLWYSNSTDFVNWNNTIQIPGNFSSTDVPSLANYNDALYLLWKGSGTDTRIWYSKRDPTTSQWSTQAVLPTNFTTPSGPAYIIAQDGTQHFVYRGTDNALRYSFRANDTATWSSPSTIASATSTEKPTLAFDDTGRLHLMWKASDNTVWHSVGLFNSTSYVFGTPKQINPAISTDFGVALSYIFGKYHLVYKGADVMSPLLYATSVNGDDWQAIPRIEGFSTDRPALAVSRNSYLLIWKGTGSDTSLWRSVSYDLDNAKSWTPRTQINSLLNAQSGPSLAVSDTGLHFLVFQGLNNEVLYSTSTDGATWSNPFPSLGSTGDRPTVAISGGTAFIMWKGVGTDNAIYLSRSDDGGQTWTTGASIGQTSLNGPTLIYNGGQRLHIAFRGTDSSVNYGKSEDGGQSWVITKLSGSTSDSPVLQSYNGKIMIYWKGVVGDEQFYYSVSTTEFKDWTPAITLTQFRSKFAPALLVRNGTAHIAIRGNGNDDYLYHTSGSLDIYWRASSKIAGGFSSDAPNVTQYNGAIWIVWKGSGTDNYIYYTTSTTGGSTWAGLVKMDDFKGTISTPSVLDWVNGTWINGPLHWNIVFRASNNNLRYGYSPNDPQRITEIISGANSSDGPSSVIFREKLFVIYKGAPSDNRVYSVYRRWGDNYNYLWDPIQVLPASLTTLNRPTTVVSDGVLNLFYRGTDSFIRLARSIDGVNWPYIKVLQGFTSHGPGATSYAEKLCVVWKLNTDNTVWFSLSDESGYNFSEQKLISTVSSINGPNIYTFNGRLHLVFLGVGDSSVNYCMGHDIINWNTSISIRSRGKVTLPTQLENKTLQIEESKLNEIAIPFKICFNQETHKLSTIPSTYQGLHKVISSLFGDRLPQTWILSYVDSQGDKVILSDENDLKALIEDSEGLKTIKIFIFSRDQESTDYQVIDFDAQHQIMGQTPRSGRTFDITQNQITGASESRPELVLRAKEIVKKLTKSDLAQDRREQLEVELNSLERDLSQQNIILLEKYRVNCTEKRAEKEAQKKDELKALLLNLINEQGLTNVSQNYSSKVVTQEEIEKATIQVPQMKKKYPAQVQEKAQMMKNIFAGSSTEELLDFVSKSPNSPLEQLVRNYVSH